MRIFDREPDNWSELQDMVGQLFSEMGCEVEVGRKVANVRGTKEIDVYVRDTGVTPAAIYLCECKYWKRAVPQEVAHAFRMVLQDTGAHRGFIISIGGFQKGAFEAVKNTNLDLVTFDDLQDLFFDRWRIAMGERFVPAADRLFPYWDYPGRMPQFKWNATHSNRQQQLYEAYRPIASLGPLARMNGFVVEFPMVLPAVNGLGNIEGEVRLESYRQMYDFIAANKDIALRHFQIVHGEIQPDREKGEYDPLA
jgi:hypothetical protein